MLVYPRVSSWIFTVHFTAFTWHQLMALNSTKGITLPTNSVSITKRMVCSGLPYMADKCGGCHMVSPCRPKLVAFYMDGIPEMGVLQFM